MSRVTRLTAVAVVAAFTLLVAACGSPDPTPAPAPDPTPTPVTDPENGEAPDSLAEQIAALECDAEEIGPVIRCNNFYDDYWPLMNQKIDELYEAAIAAGETEFVNWGFSEMTAREIEAFRQRFPGIEVSTRGMQFGTSGAILEAHRAGARTSDVLGGAYTIFMPVWREGLFDQTVDWAEFAVPVEFLEPDNFPGMFRGGQQEYTIAYNTDLVSRDELPTDPFGFLEPQWRNQLVSNPSYFFGAWSYVALYYGQEEATELARALIDDQGLVITSDPESMLLSGERPVLFPTFSVVEQFKVGAPVAMAPYEGTGIWWQLNGVLNIAQSPNIARAHTLWNGFDPDWIESRFEDPRATTPQPYTGLPGWSGRNPRQAAGIEAMQNGWVTPLTFEILEERERLVQVYQGFVAGDR